MAPIDLEQVTSTKEDPNYEGLYLSDKPFKRLLIEGFIKKGKSYVLQEYHLIGDKGYFTGEWKVNGNGHPLSVIKQTIYKKMEQSILKRNHIKLLNWLVRQDQKKVFSKKQ